MFTLSDFEARKFNWLAELRKILALGAVLLASSLHASQYESFNDGMSPSLNWSEEDVTDVINGGGPYAAWSNPVDPENAG